MRRRLFPFIALLVVWGVSLYAQQQSAQRREEDKVILLSAQLAEQYTDFGVNYRRVIGPARFLHNNTLLKCDTALWNTSTNVIDAVGHIEIIQQNTRLLGETLHYMADFDMGEVRGRVVELIDKENNRLRTQYLDFNTRDSIGYFYNGGSMTDGKGTVLESTRGHYYSKEQLMCFYEHVEMSTDTVHIKVDSLYYHTDTQFSEFWGNVQAWHKDGFLTCEQGTYHRPLAQYHFEDNVYVQTNDQQIWAHYLTYNDSLKTAQLRRDVQITDTTRSTIILGDRVDYIQDPGWAQVTQEPALAVFQKDEQTLQVDTLFLRMDTLRVFNTTFGAIDSTEFVQAKARFVEPPAYLAKKDSLARAALAALAADSLALVADSLSLAVDSLSLAVDSLSLAVDSLSLAVDSLAAPTDSLSPASAASPAVADSLAKPSFDEQQLALDDLAIQALWEPIDSALVACVAHLSDSLYKTLPARFLYAYPRVRAYRSDMQLICDSMVYNTLDSMARFYGDPVVWNEENQLSADSLRVRFAYDSLYRADFLSHALIVSQDANPLFFHQIQANEMLAHIRSNDVYRFDANEEVKALFYVPEDSVVTMLNIKEAKEMVVTLKNRQAQRIVYKQQIKSDAVPLFELKSGQDRVSSYKWLDSLRPKDRTHITLRAIRTQPPQPVEAYTEPSFPYTKKYFSDLDIYPASSLRGAEIPDPDVTLREREREIKRHPFRPPLPIKDTLPVKDTVEAPEIKSGPLPKSSEKNTRNREARLPKSNRKREGLRSVAPSELPGVERMPAH